MKLSSISTRWYTGYRKYIGVREDGTRQCFYLGPDRRGAEARAMELIVEYRRLIASGGKGWTPAALAAAKPEEPSATQQTAPAPAPSAPPAPLPEPAVPDLFSRSRLHVALDAYIENEERKAPHQVTYAYLLGQRTRVRRIKDAMPDRLLSEIGPDELAVAVAYFASRPVSEVTGKPISVVTASDCIKCVRAVFDWFDLTGRWEAPKRFERIFRVKRRNLMTAEERDSEPCGVETFTVEELTRIMEMAWSRWHRLFIAAALNLAMTQNELSTLTRRHLIGLDSDHPAIEKRRTKTDIFCRWGFVFPEVAEGLRWVLSTHDDERVFLTPEGQSPVRFTNNGRVDQVTAWWGRLVRRAEVRPLTFRYLRKTAADMVRKLSDRDTSEAMLSHSNDGMSKAYTNHDWEKLSSALASLHHQLAPVLAVADARPVIRRRTKTAK